MKYFLPRNAILLTVTLYHCSIGAIVKESYQLPTTVKGENGVPELSHFGLKLFTEMSKREKNFILSPYCIASSLSLAFAGATPESSTRIELGETIGINSYKQMGALRENIQSSNLKITDGVDLTMASSVWTKNVTEGYIKLVEEEGASAMDLPQTFKPVDEWITNQTKGLLKDVVSGDVDPLTVALLISAVHFKGLWTNQFDPEDTKAGFFYSNEEKRKAQFMYAKRKMDAAFSVKKLGGASVVRLDYGSINDEDETKRNMFRGGPTPRSDFCALLILPEKNTPESLQDVIKSISNYTINQTLNSLSSVEIKLYLPRFRLEWGVKSIKSALQSIGIKSAFESQTQFSIMSDNPEVRLDDVFHKVVMEVSEVGTTAAAATAVFVGITSVPPPPKTMRFDRPFLMMVLHVPTSTPLFLGQIDDPVFDF